MIASRNSALVLARRCWRMAAAHTASITMLVPRPIQCER